MSTDLTAVPQQRTTPEQMRALVERHIAAEAAGDVAGALAVYTDDVVHDVVGSPTGPLHGPAGAAAFYEMLTSNVVNEGMTVTQEYFADNAYTVEHDCTVTVTGDFMGMPGGGKRIRFRLLHVFEFRGGLISKEQVWLDGGTIAAQLTA